MSLSDQITKQALGLHRSQHGVARGALFAARLHSDGTPFPNDDPRSSPPAEHLAAVRLEQARKSARDGAGAAAGDRHANALRETAQHQPKGRTTGVIWREVRVKH